MKYPSTPKEMRRVKIRQICNDFRAPKGRPRGQKVHKKERKGNPCRRVRIGVRFGVEPPQGDEEKARHGVHERPREEHAELCLPRDPRKVPLHDGPVGHQDDFVEFKAVPSRDKRVGAFMLERGEDRGEEQKKGSHARVFSATV